MIAGDPVGTALLIIAPLGLAGVFAIALLERVVPLLPSQGIFAAIGVAAADGLWCLSAAMAASIIGGGLGALATYTFGVGLAVRGTRSHRLRDLLRRRGRLGRYLRKTRRSSALLPFTAQLLPGARLFAPLIAGTMLHDRRKLVAPVLAGLAVWNMTFISLGFALMRLTGSSNATLVTLSFGLLVGAVVLLKPLAARFSGMSRRPANRPWPFPRLHLKPARGGFER